MAVAVAAGRRARTFWAMAGQHRSWAAQRPSARSLSAVSAPSAVVKNGYEVAGWESGTSKEFLDAYPRGAYTTARTVRDGTAVFELRAHIDRTVESLVLMYGSSAQASRLEDVLQAHLEDRVCQQMAVAVSAHRQRLPDAGELRLTLLATFEEELDLYCHAVR